MHHVQLHFLTVFSLPSSLFTLQEDVSRCFKRSVCVNATLLKLFAVNSRLLTKHSYFEGKVPNCTTWGCSCNCTDIRCGKYEEDQSSDNFLCYTVLCFQVQTLCGIETQQKMWRISSSVRKHFTFFWMFIWLCDAFVLNPTIIFWRIPQIKKK